jgi:hypothetical protein
MTRVLTVTFLSLVTGALWQSLALGLPSVLNALMLPPIILAFSLQYFRPFETVLIGLWCGAIVDILGGLQIGLNMLLCLIFFFLLTATKVFSGRLSMRELHIHVAVLSFVYRLACFFLEALLYGQKTNIYIVQLAFGPLVDWMVSIPFYVVLIKLLTAFKVLDHGDLARGIGAKS